MVGRRVTVLELLENEHAYQIVSERSKSQIRCEMRRCYYKGLPNGPKEGEENVRLFLETDGPSTSTLYDLHFRITVSMLLSAWHALHII
jgi:hypothetical protein